MSLSEFYISGGTVWMNPITFVLIINVGIIIFVILQLSRKAAINTRWIESIKQLGGLALAIGVFGTLAGYFQMFGALEEMKETLPLQVIMGGAKVALITALYGLVVFMLSMVVYIGIKLANRNSNT